MKPWVSTARCRAACPGPHGERARQAQTGTSRGAGRSPRGTTRWGTCPPPGPGAPPRRSSVANRSRTRRPGCPRPLGQLRHLLRFLSSGRAGRGRRPGSSWPAVRLGLSPRTRRRMPRSPKTLAISRTSVAAVSTGVARPGYEERRDGQPPCALAADAPVRAGLSSMPRRRFRGPRRGEKLTGLCGLSASTRSAATAHATTSCRRRPRCPVPLDAHEPLLGGCGRSPESLLRQSCGIAVHEGSRSCGSQVPALAQELLGDRASLAFQM